MTLTLTPEPVTMAEIMARARELAAAKDAADRLKDAIAAAGRKALTARIRALQNRIAEQAAAEEALKAAIEARPDLFERPRTVAVDGVKFGLRKQQGAVNLDDEAKAIKRLRRKFPRRAAALIRVQESLDRKALRKLGAGELAQIGVTIDDATDEVTITAPKSELDGFVAALLAHYKQPEAA